MPLRYCPATGDCKNIHRPSWFYGHTESFYPKGIEAARYIGRYLGHPPLATSHLTDYDGKTVISGIRTLQTGEKIVVRCSALDFISSMVPHIPSKGLQMVRYAGFTLVAFKRRWREITNAALEAIRAQFPLFALDPMLKSVAPLKWRERIKASFGYDPLACPRRGRTMELAEIWEPKTRFVWMKRWLETQRMRKAARDAMKEASLVKQSRRPKSLPKYQQLPLFWNTS